MDPLVFAPTALILALFILAGMLVLSLLSSPPKRILSALFLLGALLRILYVIAMPYATRAYDWQGHLHYLTYVAEHFRMPPAQLGWETFQPPLFYFLSSPYLKIGMPQILPLLLSLGALACALWIGAMLFEQRFSRLLVAALLATFPSLIFFASRLSNDALFHFLAFAFLGFLLRFWQQSRSRDWYFASVIAGLAILTKSSALLLLPVALMTFFTMRALPVREKGKRCSGFLLTVTVIAGWFLVQRFLIEGETSLVGNIERLDPFSRVETSLTDFFTFNPLRILQCPFPVDLSDVCGRSYFFEYFFRTVILGGFSFGETFFPLSMLLLTAGMLFVPLIVLGFYRDGRSTHPHIPLMMTLLVLLIGHIAYRIAYPYSMNQDFRFSVLLPLTYYLVKGVEALQRWARDLAISVILSFSLVSSLFIVTVFFFS